MGLTKILISIFIIIIIIVLSLLPKSRKEKEKLLTQIEKENIENLEILADYKTLNNSISEIKITSAFIIYLNKKTQKYNKLSYKNLDIKKTLLTFEKILNKYKYPNFLELTLKTSKLVNFFLGDNKLKIPLPENKEHKEILLQNLNALLKRQ